MNHSILNESRPPADGTGVRGDYASEDHQKRSPSAVSQEEERVQDGGDPNGRSKVQPRWMPRLLALLFVACLLFAAWVWYQILCILI